MEPHQDVVDDAHILEQTDILEGAGDAHAAELGGGFPGGADPVQEDVAPGGLVDVGEQVEDRGLSRAVGTDEAGDLRPPDGDLKFVDGGEAAEVDAQVVGLQHRGLVQVPLRDEALGTQGVQLFTHEPCPPFSGI